ncbi:MAG: hypothetical protein AVDCRST_MAG80-2180 [uncultured Rubrobacteraceae bacterium]|uniref:UPF0235 protein AVDCRST_MAG80-2180 n=1 Tax=uncultured Rubrobacteraceae bacterium TaxID=349277 RepID=A0A6J4QTC5_9ACTN|nr:MAG: hypothetical protein AVDCRST_MAG80-2180 [uncultured Rubrobacteraceae bacterium]
MSKAGTRVRAEDFVRPVEGGVYVKLRVSPGAKSTAVKGLYGEGAIRLSVAAPPVEGKANAEVERYLARLCGLSRSEVTVVKGASSRDKLIFVSGIGPDEIRTRLSTLL